VGLVELKMFAAASNATHSLEVGQEIPSSVVPSMRLARHFDDVVGCFEV
jgi:adenosyl cobinamide kinase/adenosyl cobinamide phosphate guanylyltransferase